MEDNGMAVIGIGCRFPGADDIDEFWRLLRNGENHVFEVSRDRFNVSAYYDPDKDKAGKTYSKTAGLVKDYNMIDNQVYGIDESDAARMDPQQSFVLDCTHMALEDAGIPPSSLRGSKTGVYIGCMNTDYKDDIIKDTTDISNNSQTGCAGSSIASRVAYIYNLQGPALIVDTACSSALVALHTAARAICAGDVDMAICGGVNAIMGPTAFVALSRAKMAGATGQCQAFSDNADGYARGEGCGIIIIKKYSKALLDGNKIWARILTGCNQDGQTVTPMTAPSGAQQMALMKHVYEQSRVDPMSIQYIEAHGTGTPIGDPVEVNTLGLFFSMQINGEKRGDRAPVIDKVKIGSVKSNIGHLESAAGVASVIKMVLMMKHGEFVPSLMSEPANKKIQFDRFRIEVSKEVCEWKTNSSNQRLGSINCFGFGGTNSHAIVIQENDHQVLCHRNKEGTKYIFAHSAENVVSLKAGLRHTLSSINETICLKALSSTSVLHRDHYISRVAFCVESNQDLKRSIKSVLEEDTAGVSFKSTLDSNIVAVFRGRESCQNVELETDENFISKKCKKIFKKIIAQIHPTYDNTVNNFLKSDLSKNTIHLGRLLVFAKQVTFFEVLKSCGVTPNTMVGISEGIISTAYLTGKLSFKQAVKILQNVSSFDVYEVAILKDKEEKFDPMVSKANWCEYYEKEVTPNEHQSLQQAVEKDKFNILINFGQTGRTDKNIEQSREGNRISSIFNVDCQSNNDLKKVLCILYENGFNIRWETVVSPCCNITSVPKCTFSRSITVHETEKWKLQKYKVEDPFRFHQFIRRCPEYFPKFKVTLSEETTPLLYQHFVSKVKICPGTLHAEIGFEIGKRLFQCYINQLEVSTEILKPIRVSRDVITELDVTVEDRTNIDEVRFISFFVYKDKTLVARGSVIKADDKNGVEEFVDLSEVQNVCPNAYPRDKIYDSLEQLGFSYGNDLKLLCDGFTGDNICLCPIELSRAVTIEITETNIHPSVLDGLLHIPGMFINEKYDLEGKSILPIGSESIRLRRPLLKKMLAYGKKSKRIKDDIYFDIMLLTPNGSIICEVQNNTAHVIDTDNISPMARSFAYSCFFSKIEKQTLTKPQSICKSDTTAQKNMMYIMFSGNEKQSQTIVDILKPGRCMTFPFCTESFEKLESSLTDTSNESRIIVIPKEMNNFYGASGDDVFDTVFFNCQTLLKLVIYLYKAGIKEHVFVLTNNVVKNWESNTHEAVGIFGSELYGLVRSVLREQLIRQITLIDIDSIKLKSIRRIEAAFDISIAENLHELKITENGLYKPFFSRSPLKKTIANRDEKELRLTKGCYIIVGGFSGLGFEILKILASQGAAVLVALSRRAPNESDMLNIIGVEKEFGCQVIVQQADVTDYHSIEFALSNIQTLTKYPIKGIFNGAGVMDNVIALNVIDDFMKSILLPKVKGTWNLHIASIKLGLELDVFIAHSSISAILGNAGQSCYSAANCFMDAVVHFRRFQGLPGQTINWGALDLGMMTEMLENDNIKSNFEKGNLKLMSIHEIKVCFLESLTTDYCQIAYASTKEKNLVSLSLEMNEANKAGVLQTSSHSAYSTSTDLMSLSDEDLKTELENITACVTSEVFSMSMDELKIDWNFLDLGADSMLVMTFNTRIFDLTNVRVPVVLLLTDGTTIRTISDYIFSKLKSSNETLVEEILYDLTPMQERLLRIQKEMPDDPSLVTMVDIQLPHQFSDPDKWRSNLQYQIDQNSYLRSVFLKTEQGSRRKVLEIKDAKVDFISLKSEREMQKEIVWGMDKSQYRFDLENHLPLRVYFYEAKKRKSWIRFVFHDIVFNFEIIRLLLEDMKQYALHRIFSTPVPRKRDAVDTASIINDHLNKNISVLEKFWKDVLCEKQLSEVSLCPPSKSEYRLNKPEEYTANYAKVSGDFFLKINIFLRKNRITMFEFVLCAFQILLHNLTSQSTITVIVSVDLRDRCHGIGDTMSSCVNNIPIISEVRTNIKEFVTENVLFIRRCLDHALMPFEKILSLIEQQNLRDRILLHRLIVNEHFSMRIKSDTKNDIFEGGGEIIIRHGSVHYETNLFFKIDEEKNEIEFQLVLNPIILGYGMHDKINQGVVNIMKDIIESYDNNIP